MAQVRTELGADALILSTRKTSDGVEVTAALDDPPRPVLEYANPATVRNLAFHGVPSELAAVLSRGDLNRALSTHLRFGELALSKGSRPLILAGSPGAGKTLTVARLATRLVMGGIQPMVITADARRAGAAEQLAAFTRVLGIDLVVASSPVSMARALARRQNAAPVLIDMPGGCPFDPAQIEELTNLAATANAKVAVVMAAGRNPAEAGDMASAFSNIGAEYLIVTQLDLARRIGCVLTAAQAGLALVEAGIGPGAADGLVPMTVELLVHRLTEVPANLEPRS